MIKYQDILFPPKKSEITDFYYDLSSDFVQIQIAGENKNSHMAAKMICSSESDRMQYVAHTIDGSVLTILQESPNVRCETAFEAYDDTNALRVRNKVTNITSEDIVLEEVSALCITGLGDKENPEDLLVTKFLQSHQTECQPQTRSMKEMGVYGGVRQTQHRMGGCNIGSWSSKEMLPMGILEDRGNGKFLMFQIESNNSWYNDFQRTLQSHQSILYMIPRCHENLPSCRAIPTQENYCHHDTIFCTFVLRKPLKYQIRHPFPQEIRHIIKNTSGTKGDHFWDSAEMNLLKALVLYVDQNYKQDKKNMGEVYRLLTLRGENALNNLFSGLRNSHPAKAPYALFQQASETVRSGVIIGLGSRLQVFQSEMIKKITASDEIDLELPGQKPCAYFLVTSDQDSTFDFLASLFLSFVFIKLVRYADKNCEGGKLPVPVHILGEELTACGTIPDLSRRLSVIRSRNISMSCVFQNLAGLQNRYPYNLWQEIIGNCDIQLFLGCTDPLTAEFVSDRTGLASVAVTSKAKQLATFRVTDYTPEYRETSGVGKRPVLTPDEVLRLPIDEALIIVRGMKPLKVYKYDYSIHPEYSKLQHCKASNYVPVWRRKELDKAKNTTFDVSAVSSSKRQNNQKKNKNKAKNSNSSNNHKGNNFSQTHNAVHESQPAAPVSSPNQKEANKDGHIVTTKNALMVDNQ